MASARRRKESNDKLEESNEKEFVQHVEVTPKEAEADQPVSLRSYQGKMSKDRVKLEKIRKLVRSK